MLNSKEIKFCSFGVILLTVLNALNLAFGQPFWPITQIIYLGSDTNFPAWYSSILLVFAGLLAYECSCIAKKYNTQGHYPFLLFALLLFTMSMDEIARMHEVVGEYLSNKSGAVESGSSSNAPWVYVGGPIVIIVFALFVYRLKGFLLLVPKSLTYLIAGFACIIIGGVLLESATNYLNHDNLSWLWDIEIVVEETLEMLGTIFIMMALVIWRDEILKRNSMS
jgi:hypothetical protein